jgi:hypothetical protein
MTTLLLSLTVALSGDAALAKECKGVNFPEQIQVNGLNLVLNGTGLRQATAFKVNVYVAALYVPKASNDAAVLLSTDAPNQMTLQFVRNVGVSDLRKAWTEGFEKNAKATLPTLKDRISTFNGWMEDMKTGGRMIFAYKPGSGVEVSVNGAAKGTISGADFAKALLAIWLGDPPNPEIKAGLLGGPCG